MRVINEINIYEINNKETKVIEKPKVVVKSHWNFKDRFIIEFGDNNITVLADDFRRAIDNACNHRQF